MHRVELLRRFCATFLLIAAVLIGCGDGSPLGPESRVNVTRSPDNFLLQVFNMDAGTETLTYTWENTGTQATIDVNNGISSGSAIMTIQDAAGTVVHQEDIANDNDTETSVGVAGSWTIEVRIQNASGTFNLIIMKKT